MVEHRKQAVSIRLGDGDVRNIKRVAQRLGVRDSDIIRYAVKSMLNRISPLCDDGIRGRNLVPVLVESGDELIRYFELDAYRLDSIINDRAGADSRVDRDDIALLAMSGLREQYLFMRQHEGAGVPEEAAVPARSLRAYLYDKYVYRQTEHRPIETTSRETSPRETTSRETASRDSAPRDSTSRAADLEGRAGQRPAA